MIPFTLLTPFFFVALACILITIQIEVVNDLSLEQVIRKSFVMGRTFLWEPVQDSDAKAERRKQTDWIAMMERKSRLNTKKVRRR